MKRTGFLALLVVLFTFVLACQSPPAAGNPQGPGESNTPEPTTPEPAVPEQARPLVDLAKVDLSRRKGIPIEQIKVVSVEEVNWPNGSLGFPKPGMVYIQVIIPGYRITLTDGAQTYEYHTDKDKHVEHGD